MRPLASRFLLCLLHQKPPRASRPLNCCNYLFRSMASTPAKVEWQYEYNEDIEMMEHYQPGGYHPVTIGDVLHARYRVVHKLGHGSYSTIWLARDALSQRLVAVKVGIAESNLHEVDIMSALTAAQNHKSIRIPGKAMIPSVLDSFSVRGPNGVHPCYVTAPARVSLSDVQEASYLSLFQLDVARALAAQLTLAVVFIHSQGFVHGDIQLHNVLLQLPYNIDRLSDTQLYKMYGPPSMEPVVRFDGQKPALGVPTHGVVPVWFGEWSEKLMLSEAKILLTDFGQTFMPSQQANYHSHVPSYMKPPEARFEPTRPLSFPSDVWSLACAIWSILCQAPLFDPWCTGNDQWIINGYVDALGILPPEWWCRWEARKARFADNGTPLNSWLHSPTLEDRFELDTQEPRRKNGMLPFEQNEKDAVIAMLRSMLSYKPEDRITAAEALEFEWMRKWAMPEYEKIRHTSRP